MHLCKNWALSCVLVKYTFYAIICAKVWCTYMLYVLLYFVMASFINIPKLSGIFTKFYSFATFDPRTASNCPVAIPDTLQLNKKILSALWLNKLIITFCWCHNCKLKLKKSTKEEFIHYIHCNILKQRCFLYCTRELIVWLILPLIGNGFVVRFHTIIHCRTVWKQITNLTNSIPISGKINQTWHWPTFPLWLR